MFDKKYAEEECLWGLSPDSILVENIREIPVGNALDIGCGEGRNALYLAHKGFQVTGIDVSQEAIRKFVGLAKERGLTVEGLVMDIRDFEFKPNTYSVVIASATLHFLKKSEVHEMLFKIIDSTVLGGYVCIEDFTIDDPSYSVAKERCEQIEENTFYSKKLSSYLYFFSHNELKEIFKDFKIEAYKEETIIDSGHGKDGHPHKHGMVQLFAEKKNIHKSFIRLTHV